MLFKKSDNLLVSGHVETGEVGAHRPPVQPWLEARSSHWKPSFPGGISLDGLGWTCFLKGLGALWSGGCQCTSMQATVQACGLGHSVVRPEPHWGGRVSSEGPRAAGGVGLSKRGRRGRGRGGRSPRLRELAPCPVSGPVGPLSWGPQAQSLGGHPGDGVSRFIGIRRGLS